MPSDSRIGLDSGRLEPGTRLQARGRGEERPTAAREDRPAPPAEGERRAGGEERPPGDAERPPIRGDRARGPFPPEGRPDADGPRRPMREGDGERHGPGDMEVGRDLCRAGLEWRGGPGGMMPFGGRMHGPPQPDWKSFEKADPEMSKLFQEEEKLERQTRELAMRYRQAEKEQKADIKKQLTDSVKQQFEVRQQRRNLDLKRLEEELKRLREAIDARNRPASPSSISGSSSWSANQTT